MQAIAQVYGLQVGATGPLRVKSVVEAIAGSVQRTFGRTIRFALEGPAPHRWALPEAESIPIALTVNELLTNAVKHSAGAEVCCTLTCGEDGVRIAIGNAGRLPEGFDRRACAVACRGWDWCARCCHGAARRWPSSSKASRYWPA
ncbi:hypothetical protein FSC37_04550 [Piscinibacter aquaticus]|uniref:Sensor histidine kinase n=1 Tax=Piscinibacter aquaticus TaxID=392597 RepID=A0A5C6TYH0_9BURK|nr:hypothetical protein FSC37_04550 [Piscinibacter aquaticus]